MAEYIDTASFAATASISSAIFNPPPTVHSNESSTYHNSCSVSIRSKSSKPKNSKTNCSFLKDIFNGLCLYTCNKLISLTVLK